MSTRYFKNFAKRYYNFGDNEPRAIIQDLSQYVDIIDSIKNEISFYEDYTIIAGERPDNVSYKLYGTTDYYWTFFMLNDHLREQGWPIPRDDILARAKLNYPHRTVTSESTLLAQLWNTGQVVTGVVSGTVGTIIDRNLELGQLIIDTTNTTTTETGEAILTVNENGFAQITVDNEDLHQFHSVAEWNVYKDDNLQTGGAGTGGYTIQLENLNRRAEFRQLTFTQGAEFRVEYLYYVSNGADNNFGQTENITYRDAETGFPYSLQLIKENAQYNAVHHYEDSDGNWVDIDPFSQGGLPGLLTPITVLERLENENEALKQIKVLKKDAVVNVTNEFYKLLSSGV